MAIYQYVLKGLFSGSDILRNIHHYEFPNYVPTATEADEVAQGLADRLEEDVLALLSGNVTLEGIDYRRVDVGDEPTSNFTPSGWPIVGGGGASMLPPQVAALVTWKAPTVFPRSTRSYMFPFAVSQNSATGTIVIGARTLLDAWALSMEEIEVTGQTDAQKVAVRYEGDPRAVVASNVVFATPTTSIWATQRSRRYGVGD